MATTGIISDDEYYILVNSVKFTHITSCSLTIGQETIDITSFDSAGWKEIKSGDLNWSMDVEAYYAMDAAENGDEASADIVAGTSHTLLLSTEVTGDTTFSGTAYPTSFSINSSKGSAVTLSVSYEGTGALTIGTVSA
jgi:predicted secreted protein